MVFFHFQFFHSQNELLFLDRIIISFLNSLFCFGTLPEVQVLLFSFLFHNLTFIGCLKIGHAFDFKMSIDTTCNTLINCIQHNVKLCVGTLRARYFK